MKLVRFAHYHNHCNWKVIANIESIVMARSLGVLYDRAIFVSDTDPPRDLTVQRNLICGALAISRKGLFVFIPCYSIFDIIVVEGF